VVPNKDKNGNLTSYTFPNRAKALKDIRDDLQTAMEKFDKVLYVNQDTGDDNKDGLTEATAFKTLNKAVDVVSSGGTGFIYLQTDYLLDKHIYVKNKKILIHTANSISSQWGLNIDDRAFLFMFYLKNSDVTLWLDTPDEWI